MNTLDDLRRTLDTHAGDVLDETYVARTAAVRGRAAVVRRRRAAGVATAAALAVVGAVGIPRLVSDVEPGLADRQLLGRTAPAELVSLGYTYEFERGVENPDGPSRIELGASDEPRLVTWAADAPVEVVRRGLDAVPSDRVDFDDWTYVAPGVDGTWTVRGDATAVAVYTLGNDRPEGVTVDGITYRDQVADQQLLGAEIGRVGDDEVSVTYTVPAGDTAWSPFCAGAERNVWIHLDLGDRLGEMVSGSSCEDPTFDPGGLGGYSGPHGRTGETITATLYLTDSEDGPRVDLDDVRLGLGVYSVAEPGLRVAGTDVAELLEDDGHLWSLDGAEGLPRGTTELELRNDDTRTWLVEAISAGIGNGLVRVRFPEGDGTVNLGTGGSTRGHLAPGERVTMSARGDHPERVQLGFARYARID